MTALDRKLLRDLWAMRGQALAICLVMACGVATFVMSLSTLRSIELAQSGYYERYRFAQVFTRLKRAPNAVAERIAEIPGVGQVQTRVVVDVTLDVAGFPEPVGGRLISIPERVGPGLNDVVLRKGRYVEPGAGGEVLASEGFVNAHGLQPGDKVRAVINGRLQELRIVGVVLSPEYVYQIRPGDILPDDRRFGVFWMSYAELAPAFNMQGAFNDVTLTLAPGASEPEVLRRLDRLTEPYGGLGAYGRADQPSHQFIANEVRQLRSMSLVAPSIFLSVAAFLLNVVVTRLIRTQREQIAALKAFGYTHLEVGWHYVQMVLLFVAVGVGVGTLLGALLGTGLTEMYTKFFHFPNFDYVLEAWVVLAAAGLTGSASVLGTLGAVRAAVRLPPAEAMRPEPPARYRPTVVERLGLQRLFSQSARMILRNLERHPAKSFLSSFGISMAIAVLVLGNFMSDTIDFVMESEYRFAQRQDLTVMFVEPTSWSALYEIRHLPGVWRCEPFRSVPVRMRAGPRSRRVGVMGLPPDADLHRLIDVERRPVALSEEGLVLSAKLAEILEVGVGDVVTLEVMEGERPVRDVPVVGLINDFSGLSAYMSLGAANRLMREGPTVSGAFVAADPAALNDLYYRLKNTPRVAGVAIKEATLTSFRETVAENLLRFRTVNVLFACVIAFGVVYNSARIALAERGRELATLRVIGFTRGEISFILLGELAVLTVLAIPLGLLLGYGFGMLAVAGGESELFRMPLIVNLSTYAFAVSVVLLAALASGMLVRRKLDDLDLVAVLKAKE